MKRKRGKIAAPLVVLVLTTGAAWRVQAQTLTVLYSFKGGGDGADPPAGLVMDTAGNLYGTASTGGFFPISGKCDFSQGCGTVFKLAPSGNEMTLHSFTGPSDGAYPAAGLILDAAGNLYGNTYSGGSGACTLEFGGVGCGTLFRLDPSGNETILHSFLGGSDGTGPSASLIMDKAGNLYGTTAGGGSASAPYGTLFKLDPSGTKTVLHSFVANFGGGGDGATPEAALIMDAAGNLYGATDAGGSSASCSNGCGTVFKLDPAGHETVLHSFLGGSDGANPGSLIMDAAGNLYGTTANGGAFGGGTVFELDTSLNKKVLHNFSGYPSDGSGALGLVMDGAGNLYGITSRGGSSSCSCGTVFKLDASGKETVLYNFTGGNDGLFPTPGLIMDAARNLYGTAIGGGVYGSGTVFKLSLSAVASRKRLVQVTSE